MRINIKPMSVNAAWQGRRFKTAEYKKYRDNLLRLLPKMKMPKPPYSLSITWGFSSVASDIDNPTKPFLDALQDRYKINDKDIYRLELFKMIVPKGQEFIDWEVESNPGLGIEFKLG